MTDQNVTEVLNHRQIHYRIRRMAWQIYEHNQEENSIVLAGVAERGYQLANLIAEVVREISPLEVKLLRISVVKEDPLSSDPVLDQEAELSGTSVIVVDDVLNTGATLIYAVKHFLQYRVRSLKTAILVDRSHKNYPIKGDFKGISLSTNMMERVQVKLQDEPYSVVVS